MDPKTRVVQVLLLLVLLLTLALGQRQKDCAQQGTNSLLNPTTSMTPLQMSCTVDPGAQVNETEQFLWEWLRLDNSMNVPITSGLASDRQASTYTLQVECSSSGFYQALYYRATDNDTCLFSCLFVIEVEETTQDALRDGFSVYPMIMNDLVPTSPSELSIRRARSVGTLQLLVGTCSNTFRNLASRCVADVDGRWYRNGTRFNPGSDTSQYILSTTTGELQIRNLTEATIGYYSCVTSVPGLGRYLTVDVTISVSTPTARPPLATPTTPPRETDAGTIGIGGDRFGTLRVWEFGLIVGVVSLVVMVVLLGGAVWLGRLTVKRRREQRRRGKVQYHKAPAPPQPLYRRPLTMIEEIQMMEEENVETVDLGVSSSPVEIVFGCILFEELLHKGTFKVVHHGVVNQPSQGLLGTPAAVKRLKEEKSELGYEELMNEAVFLRTFQEKADSHPNIVSLLGLTMEGGPTCLLLEFLPHGTLEDFLLQLKLGPIPEWYMRFVRDTLRGAYHKHVSGDLMNIVMQVVEGMKFLTDQGFIHRDLSVRNIMMGERLNIKIANPGMHHEGYYYVVTEREHFLQDMAPECLWEKRHSVCSDVWSFGILVYRVVTLDSTPFPNMQVDSLHSRMVGGERPQLLASFSNEMYFMLQRCWQFVATERPSFSTLDSDLSHMAEKPTRHILLKCTKDPAKPGYVSENGQVFLRGLPPHALEEDGPPQKKGRRGSGTMRSLISSIDDTVYTRETAETILDLTQSENEENYNNYEQYLKGDLPVPLPPGASGRGYDETDTSGSGSKSKPKRKGSKTREEGGSVAESPGKASERGSTRKKRRKVPSKEKAFTNKAFGKGGSDEGDASSTGAPSITEEDKGGVSSGSDASEGSQSELVRL